MSSYHHSTSTSATTGTGGAHQQEERSRPTTPSLQLPLQTTTKASFNQTQMNVGSSVGLNAPHKTFKTPTKHRTSSGYG